MLKELINKNHFFESERDETRKRFFSNFDITFDLLEKATQSKDFGKYFNFAYLQLFLIIEEWLKLDFVFVEENGSCFVINADNRYQIRKPIEDNIYEYAISWKIENNKGFYSIDNCTKENKKSYEDTMFKMSAVLLFKFGVETMKGHKWGQISWVRNNKAAHPENSIVSKQEIFTLIKFMLYIFDTGNYSRIDVANALKETTNEEKLEMLKAKFSSKK